MHRQLSGGSFLAWTEAVQDLMNKLACQREELRVYRKGDLPTRLHFSNNRRIEDIILDLDPGYVVSTSFGITTLGNHGYDYHNHAMNVSVMQLH